MKKIWIGIFVVMVVFAFTGPVIAEEQPQSEP